MKLDPALREDLAKVNWPRIAVFAAGWSIVFRRRPRIKAAGLGWAFGLVLGIMLGDR